jgi:hypothetical protein
MAHSHIRPASLATLAAVPLLLVFLAARLLMYQNYGIAWDETAQYIRSMGQCPCYFCIPADRK